MNEDGYLFIGDGYVFRVNKHSLQKQFEVELILSSDAIIIRADVLPTKQKKPEYCV